MTERRLSSSFNTPVFLWGLLIVILAGVTILMIWVTQLIGSAQKNPAPDVHQSPMTTPVMVPIPPAESTSWTMIAVGDIMLDRHVRETIEKNGKTFPFAQIKNFLADKDIVLGNLEGPFTSNDSAASNEKLVFTFDPAMAPILRQTGFTTLSLANNHTFNFGQAGLDSTREIMRQGNLEAFGDPKNRTGFTLVKEIRGQKIGFIGYHGLVKGFSSVLQEIRDLDPEIDTLIVVPHWGIEYSLTPSERQRSEARQMIEAGADMVIGAHPHVVQPVEIYQGKFIAYSLGNFLFDQYFSQDTLEGLMLEVTMTKNTPTIQFIPIVTKQQQIQLLDGPRKEMMLQRLAKDSMASNQKKKEIGQGKLVIDP